MSGDCTDGVASAEVASTVAVSKIGIRTIRIVRSPMCARSGFGRTIGSDMFLVVSEGRAGEAIPPARPVANACQLVVMNLSGLVTTGDSTYRLRYSSWMPLLCTCNASGPTWPAVLSVKSSTSVSLQVVAVPLSGQQAIFATPVAWLPISSHWLQVFTSHLVCGSCLNRLPPPLFLPGR